MSTAPQTRPSEKPQTGRRKPRRSMIRSKAGLFALQKTIHGINTVSPALAAQAVLHLMSMPAKHRRPQREHDVLSSATPRTFSTRHGKLKGWSWGKGPKILLVHGWEGRGAQFSAFVEPLVEAGFEVITYDTPGHGSSPGRFGSAIHVADSVEDVLREIGEVAALAAHSMGALGVTMALGRGVKLKKLLYIAPAGAPDEGIKLARKKLKLSEEMIEKVRRGILAREPMRWYDLQHGAVPRGVELPELQIIHDKDDRMVTVEMASRIEKQWPGAQVHLTEGLGHNRILRDADVVRMSVDYLKQPASS